MAPTASLHAPHGGRRAGTGLWRDVRPAAWLEVLMVVTIGVVSLFALWDETREASAAFQDFAEGEATLASVTAAGLSAERAAHPGGSLDEALAASRAAASARGRSERAAVVLLRPPGSRDFVGEGHGVLRSAALSLALDEGRSWVRLGRAEAAEVGLPPRTAVAGLAINPAPDRWAVAVVSSARRERDREFRARWRLALGTLLAGALVLAFGGAALRMRRKEMELEQAIAVSELQWARDEQLAREGRAAMMVTLAAGVAHEVSTPLNVIAGRAEQLEGRLLDERNVHAVKVILDQAGRIRDVIHGFLQLARGGQPVLERVSTERVVRAAVSLVEHRFAGAGIALTAEVPPEPPVVLGDARLLEQALVNLLLNACDACERGGHVAVRVEVAPEHATFAVLDDGAGISPGAAARVLEPFFTTKPRDQGTGLGLAIASEIVAIHRGTLDLAPREPRGTRAAFRIPTPPGASDGA